MRPSPIVPRSLATVLPILALLAAALPPSMAHADGPRPSGLPWASGASGVAGKIDGFEAWRGRPLDVLVIWHPWWKKGWDGIGRFSRTGVIAELDDWQGRVSMGYAMFPKGSSHEACAAGDYDRYHEDLAEQIAAFDRRDIILRVGWEANGSYPWNANNDPDPGFANYKACFRRIVGILRAAIPEVTIDWTSRKRGAELFKGKHRGLPLSAMYPGDDVVDLIGVDYYDSYPSFADREAWDDFYMQNDAESPKGLGAWLAFARARGKKLSFPEWAVRYDDGHWDNPFFVEAMHRFFADHAADIGYEAYFNSNAEGHADGEGQGSTIFPVRDTPGSGERYRELWSADPSG